MTEVGLDVAVGPQEGDDQAVILPWGGPPPLVGWGIASCACFPRPKTSVARGSLPEMRIRVMLLELI